ncbi:hypothetical protein ACHAXR_000392, partial [Thalassiosira sp. AJA248-18]
MSGGELTLDWCMSPDIGLPAPDAVIFLDLDQDEAEKRGGYFRSRQLRGEHLLWEDSGAANVDDCFTSHYPSNIGFIPSLLTIFSLVFMFGSYGGERYEKRDLQMRVRRRFAELQSIDEKHGRVPWHVVDASQSIDEVKENLASIVADTLERVQGESAPLCRMWGEGEYELPEG